MRIVWNCVLLGVLCFVETTRAAHFRRKSEETPLDINTGFTLPSQAQAHSSAGVVDETVDLTQLETDTMLRELEMFVKHLTDDQLDKLEDILDEEDYPVDEATQANELLRELRHMGMEEGDITDLNILADDMTAFLNKIPMLSRKLRLGREDLADNVKLYLLGLDNKLGPLGFLALHSTLTSDDFVVDSVDQPTHGARSKRGLERVLDQF